GRRAERGPRCRAQLFRHRSAAHLRGLAQDRQQARGKTAAAARRRADAERGEPEEPLTAPVTREAQIGRGAFEPSGILASLQRYLTDIYRTDHGLSVGDFLITDPAVVAVLGSGSLLPSTEESVLLT